MFAENELTFNVLYVKVDNCLENIENLAVYLK